MRLARFHPGSDESGLDQHAADSKVTDFQCSDSVRELKSHSFVPEADYLLRWIAAQFAFPELAAFASGAAKGSGKGLRVPHTQPICLHGLSETFRFS